MKSAFSSLDRKLLRDLWSLKTQVLSIALVIACGIGAFVGSFSTHSSLLHAREHYYDSARFAHVFASAKRAPASLAARIRAIPGVAGLLMEALMRAAQEHGLASMEGMVLRENREMLRFVKALGFEATPDPAEPTMARVERTL